MDDNRITQFLEALEADLANDDTAKLRSIGGNGFVTTEGNRVGFLRLAICCMQAATSQVAENGFARIVDLGDSVLQGERGKEQFHIGFFTRAENLPDFHAALEARRLSSAKNDRWFLLGCSVVALIFLMPFFIGMGVILQLLFGSK